MSPQRRRSKAISVSVSPTGLPTTAWRKFCLYWIQSQTTRSRDRSAGDAQTASMIGPSADRAAADSRSFFVGRRSTSIAGRPDAGPSRMPGTACSFPATSRCTPATPSIVASSWMVSAASRAPSAAVWSAGTPFSLRYTSSGTCTPGTLSRMKSSARRDLIAPTPARM